MELGLQFLLNFSHEWELEWESPWFLDQLLISEISRLKTGQKVSRLKFFLKTIAFEKKGRGFHRPLMFFNSKVRSRVWKAHIIKFKRITI